MANREEGWEECEGTALVHVRVENTIKIKNEREERKRGREDTGWWVGAQSCFNERGLHQRRFRTLASAMGSRWMVVDANKGRGSVPDE